jgi:Ca2+/H+ antiporter, TMEM165/GDT1 family
MKSTRFGRFIFAVILVQAAIFLFGSLVHLLWNNVAVPVLHVSTITFWQAIGILVLSKILFSSFSGGRGGGLGRYTWRRRMMTSWKDMTPEEKEKFRQEWKDRCGPWGMRSWDADSNDAQPGTQA